MRFLSLFAGIGGFDLGLKRAGHECAGQVEIDWFCNRILDRRFHDCQRWSDVRQWRGEFWYRRNIAARRSDGRIWEGDRNESPDLLCGGFPCQDLSVAGKRTGLSGSRSGLFWEIIRIAKIIKPPWGLFENVPGLLSSGRGADMWTVLAGLRECWPAVGYRILDSRYFGVAQRRRRAFFVCGPSEASVRQVLFEPEGGCGDSQASGEAGEGVARAVARGSVSSVYRYDPNGENFVIPIQYAEQWGRDKRQNGSGIGQEGDPSFTLDASYPHGVTQVSYGWNKSSSQSMAVDQDSCEALQASPTSNPAVRVRRLTPLECERLQGFSDGWTCLCQPLEAYRDDPDEAAMRCKCPDSPRYRALGNAVTVNVVEWIGRRLR